MEQERKRWKKRTANILEKVGRHGGASDTSPTSTQEGACALTTINHFDFKQLQYLNPAYLANEQQYDSSEPNLESSSLVHAEAYSDMCAL